MDTRSSVSIPVQVEEGVTVVILAWPLDRLGGERAAARALEILKQAG